MITTAIVFDHRGRTKNGSEGPLEVRVTQDRHPYYINTGVRVKKSQWAFDKVVRHPQANELNERLSILVGKIMQSVNDKLKDGQEVDVAAIKREVWDVSAGSELIDWLGEEIDRLYIEAGTHKHYKTLVKRLKQWGGMHSWGDATADNVIAFDVWLRTVKYNGLPLSDAGRHNYHKNLKHLLNRAAMLGKIQSNPYGKLRGRFKRGDVENTEYLTDEEVAKIMRLQPTPGTMMDMAKDLFVFQLWTGLAYQDAQAFDFSRYKKIDGKWRLTAKRIKTGEPFVSQLLPPAVAVLEKYGMNTPKIINAVYNRELRDIGISCGIRTRLHSHIARHTFATYMLRHGVPLQNVSRMLGHTNIKQTLRYAKVLAEDIHEDYARISNLLTQQQNNHEEDKPVIADGLDDAIGV